MAAHQSKVENFAPSSKHPNDSKNNSLIGTSLSNDRTVINNSLPKKGQNKLQFSNSVKSTNKKTVNKLDEAVKRIQINKSQTPSGDSSSESDMDSQPRRYFPPSLPQEVVESHVDKPKVTGFLEDDSDEELLRTDPSIAMVEDTPQPSQVSQELELSDMSQKVPDKVTQTTEKIQGKRRKRVQRPVSECFINSEGSLVTKTKFVMVSTTDESEPETKLESALKKVKPSTGTKQSSISSFFKSK